MRVLALSAIALLLVAAASGSFLSFGDAEYTNMETEADRLDEVALDPKIVKVFKADASEDEMVMRSFEEVAESVEATIQKPRDPTMVSHLQALEAIEAEVEADAEMDTEENSFLESGPVAYSPDLVARVDEALRANDASFGIGDMAKKPVQKVFPKIGKGEKTLASDIPLAKVKDYLQEALNTKRSTISEAEDLMTESEKFIAKWEKENGGHFCKKLQGAGGNCKKPEPANAPPVPNAKIVPTPSQMRAKAKRNARRAMKAARRAKAAARRAARKAARK